MQVNFKNQKVIVTGAAQGIGRAICDAFSSSGAEVIGTDIDRASLNRVAQRTGLVDVTDPDAVQDFVDENGPFHIAVHVAGGVCGQIGRPIEQIAPDEWEKVTAVNQTGAFNLARAVVPGMKKLKHGRIITISSRAGLDVSLTGIQAYASAKAGQIGLVRQLGHELGEFGITVNCVAPGFVRSNPTTEKQWQALGLEGQKKLVSGIAMRRLGDPEDIASAVLFLGSDQASWITGQVLSVDGGR
tara:strand:+ start:161 stop:889 length:729 start_codon:yes stop_codon:yes gene_type:complete